MSQYKISRDFFPFSHFTPPISEKFLAMAVPHMKTPKSIFKDKELDVSRHEIKSYDGAHCLKMHSAIRSACSTLFTKKFV